MADFFITPLQGFCYLQTTATQGVALGWHYLEAFGLGFFHSVFNKEDDLISIDMIEERVVKDIIHLAR